MWACFIIFQRVFSVTLNLHPSTMQTALADAFGHWEPPRDIQNDSFSLLCLPFFLCIYFRYIKTHTISFTFSIHPHSMRPHRPALQPPHSPFYLFFTVGDIALDTPKIAHKFVVLSSLFINNFSEAFLLMPSLAGLLSVTIQKGAYWTPD